MRHLILALVAACGAGAPPGSALPPAPAPPSRELSTALRPLDWWLGSWSGAVGDEHWVAASGAIYGVALGADGGFEVMVIDDAAGPGKPDGTLRLYAMPAGHSSTTFEVTQLEPTGATFANASHDFPKTIRYRLDGAQGLTATIAGDGKA